MDIPVTKQIKQKSALKRKSSSKDKTKEKRTKTSSSNVFEQSQMDEDVNDDDLYKPTEAELNECEKAENIKNIITNRQKKKQKHIQQIETQKDQTINKDVTRNEDYLKKWKYSKIDWKFEKIRQISIQQAVFDETKISTDIWPLALEYLCKSQGTARQKISELAEETINKLDKSIKYAKTTEEQRAILSSAQYQRARDLLQNIN